jgi:hypothetical protein
MLLRILLAGLAGGAILFVMSAVQQSILPGIEPKPLPSQATLLPALRASIPRQGFYFFPGDAIMRSMSSEEKAAVRARYYKDFKEGPNGIVVYHSGGEDFNFGRRLGVQFLLSFIAAGIAAWIISLSAGSSAYAVRVGLFALLGFFAFAYIEPQYWNWYGFLGAYAISRIIGGVASWALAGLAMAAIVR